MTTLTTPAAPFSYKFQTSKRSDPFPSKVQNLMKVYQFSHSRWIIHITRHITWMILCPSMYRYASAQSGMHPPEGANARYTNLDSTMAIVLLVLISAMFIVAIFCLYLGYCSDSCDDANALPSNATADYPRIHGLDPAVIETFPIFIYRAVKDLKIGRGALECAVCLSEFENDETVRLIPKCDHLFHYDCIDSWLASHVTCPVCRAELTSESNEKDQDQDQDQNNSAPEQSGSEEQSRVVIDINDEQSGSGEAQVLEISSTTRVNRPASSGVPEKFPRSHSTGHSLVQAGLNVERYTLRLPEEVRKKLMMSAKLKRTTSFNVFLATEGGFRKVGYNQSGGAGGSSRETNYVDPQGVRSDWWVFSMTPPFGPKMGSFDAANKIGDGGGGGGAKGEGSSNGRNLLTAVKTPLNCLNVKVEQGGESSTVGPRLISLGTNKK